MTPQDRREINDRLDDIYRKLEEHTKEVQKAQEDMIQFTHEYCRLIGESAKVEFHE